MNSSILNIKQNDYNEILNIISKELAVINKSSSKVELEELMAISKNDIFICLQNYKLNHTMSNWQFSDVIRKEKNNKLDEYTEFLLNINSYCNGDEESKDFFISEWIKVFNSARITYTIALMHKIRELRKENLYTKKEMANLLGISYQSYAIYEKGYRQPDKNMIVKVSRIFNVSIDYLLSLQSESREMLISESTTKESEDSERLQNLFSELNDIYRAKALGYLEGLLMQQKM